jgi:hypothetical protein
MVNDQMRQELWHVLLDTDRTCRYYEAIHSKNTLRSACLRTGSIVLILIASGTVVVLHVWPWLYAIQVGLGVTAAALTVFEVTFNYSKKASVAHTIYVGTAQVRLKLRELWTTVEDNSINEEDLRRQLRDLANQAVNIEGWAGVSDLTPDKTLNERITNAAYDYAPARYGEAHENA